MDTAELMSLVNFPEYAESVGITLEYKNGEYWGLSPFKEEKTPSFSINEEKQAFYDFSSGKGGNLLQFIMDLRHCDLYHATKELMQYAGVSDEQVSFSTRPLLVRIARKYRPDNRHKPEILSSVTPMSESYMDFYENNSSKLSVWTKEGMSEEVLNRFQVRYDPFANRLVFPIRDYDGKIVNICGRTLDEDYKAKGQRKYTYYKKWGGSMNVLFGYPEHLEEIKKCREALIFEGAKSVFIAETWGYTNGLALLTSHLSEGQFRELVKLGVHIVFALDEDVDIIKDKNIQRLRRYCAVSYIKDTAHLLSEKMSPVDAGREVWNRLYEQRKRL